MINICKHFGECGGCDYQDEDYSAQLFRKEYELKNVLSGLDIHKLDPIVPSPEIWYYRNKMEYIVGLDFKLKQGLIGLRRKKKFNRIVDLEECRIFHKDTGKIFSIFRSWMEDNNIEPYDHYKHRGILRYLAVRNSKFYNETMVVMVMAISSDELKSMGDRISDILDRLKEIENVKTVYISLHKGVADVALGQEYILLKGDGFIKERINGIDYIIDTTSFFQTNSYCCEKLYGVVKDLAKAIAGGSAIDLYCGTGGITLQLADIFDKATGVDISQKNIDIANKNLELNKIKNVDFIPLDCEIFASRAAELEGVSTLVVDPPRAGLGKKMKEAIIKSRIENLIYVSCNPVTFKSDILNLKDTYDINRITPVDMFPHTRHLEAVCYAKRI